MKILTWNCRGAAKASFPMVARDIIRSRHPTVLAILETRVSGEHAKAIADPLGYSSFIGADSVGFSGGIWLMWNKEDIDIQAISRSRWAIHAVISPPAMNPWILSAIYASPNKSLRKHLGGDASHIKSRLFLCDCG